MASYEQQDQQLVENAPVQQVVKDLVEAHNASAAVQQKALKGIYEKASYIEQRVENLQKLKEDQFRHTVQTLTSYDEDLGGVYGLLAALKKNLQHSPFQSPSDEKLFLWSASLKARSEKLYLVFEAERQLIQQKSFQTQCEKLGIECSEVVEKKIQWLDETLATCRRELQQTLRNCFRSEFLQLLEGLDAQALEREFAEAYSQPLGLKEISGIKWYGLEAYARIQNMLQQAQILVEDKHVVEGKLVSAEQILKIFDQTLDKPLKPLRPYPVPDVEVQLNQSFKDAFQNLVTKKTIQCAEDSN
jgi:hypothetical protein